MTKKMTLRYAIEASQNLYLQAGPRYSCASLLFDSTDISPAPARRSARIKCYYNIRKNPKKMALICKNHYSSMKRKRIHKSYVHVSIRICTYRAQWIPSNKIALCKSFFNTLACLDITKDTETSRTTRKRSFPLHLRVHA